MADRNVIIAAFLAVGFVCLWIYWQHRQDNRSGPKW